MIRDRHFSMNRGVQADCEIPWMGFDGSIDPLGCLNIQGVSAFRVKYFAPKTRAYKLEGYMQ